MVEEGDDFSFSPVSFGESLSSSSSPSSSRSVSETNSTDLTSGSEGDLQGPADEGIYGWILSLIEEGKDARFLNGHEGIYELDWQTVVSKYWFERRGARKDVKNIKFSHRTASNTLRAALLNAYKDKGAKELPEKKGLDSRNKTIKRCFRLPSTMIHKIARHHKKANTTPTSVGPKMPQSFLDQPTHEQHEEGSCAFPTPPLSAFTDFNSLNVDVEESESLINMYMVQQDCITDDDPGLTTTSESSDWMASNDAGSSGYNNFSRFQKEFDMKGSFEENLVNEIDPCEGPYQGGNTAFIFLEGSLYSRSVVSDRRQCKVVFSAPKYGQLTAREVTATVKNRFTIKVCVPHCPKLSVEQLACGKLTVRVLVYTSAGRYIGETSYTYNANLMAQFDHCVKALDDEDMALGFTFPAASEQQVALNYRESDLSGRHLFTFASLRVLVFAAVKEKAYNFLTTFLNSPAAAVVLQHCKRKLGKFLRHVGSSDRQTDRHAPTWVLDMCEKLLLEDVLKTEPTKQSEETPAPSQGIEANGSKEEMVQPEKEYDGGSELETSQELPELEVAVNGCNECAALEPKEKYTERLEHGLRCEKDDDCLGEEHRNVRDDNEAGKDTSVQLTYSPIPEDTNDQQGKEEKRQDNDGPSNKPKIFVLRKPCSPVPISRSRVSFPDPRTDVFVELQVRKSQKALEGTDGDGKHATVGRQHVTEHVPVTKHHVIVDVKHSVTKQSATDWESKYVKRVSGKLGYWFRFFKPNCELLLVFTLYDKPHAATKPETKLKTAAFEVLDHVTVVVETINWKGSFSKEAKADNEPAKLELALTPPVPLVSLSRSQTRLCTIMNGLHKFCDNGNWAEFEKACAHLQRHSNTADIQVAILLEKAIAFLYHHDLEKAELTALEALEVASKAENHQLLAGRAYYYLAHVYRREHKLGEAVRCIDLSKQNLHLMDVCLDQSFMAYEEGNVMKDFISGGAVLRKTLVLRAKQCFERCLDLCRRLDDSDSSAIPPTHSFALIKIAMLLLDCGSTSGRERCVSVSHVHEAKRFLGLLQRRGLDEITERRKIQFLLARADLRYRMCDYQMAIHDAEAALEKAEELGFILEVLPARNRLTHICQFLASGGSAQYTYPQV